MCRRRGIGSALSSWPGACRASAWCSPRWGPATVPSKPRPVDTSSPQAPAPERDARVLLALCHPRFRLAATAPDVLIAPKSTGRLATCQFAANNGTCCLEETAPSSVSTVKTTLPPHLLPGVVGLAGQLVRLLPRGLRLRAHRLRLLDRRLQLALVHRLHAAQGPESLSRWGICNASVSLLLQLAAGPAAGRPLTPLGDHDVQRPWRTARVCCHRCCRPACLRHAGHEAVAGCMALQDTAYCHAASARQQRLQLY